LKVIWENFGLKIGEFGQTEKEKAEYKVMRKLN